MIARLLAPRVPLWQYVLEAWPMALIPSALLAAVAMAVVGTTEVPLESVMPPSRKITGTEVFGMVIIAPVVETLLLAALIRIISLALSRTLYVALVSAVIWGSLHGLVAVVWFFGTVWSFFVFSCAYMAWRERSFRAAFLAAALPHALLNSSAVFFLAASAA